MLLLERPLHLIIVLTVFFEVTQQQVWQDLLKKKVKVRQRQFGVPESSPNRASVKLFGANPSATPSFLAV